MHQRERPLPHWNERNTRVLGQFDRSIGQTKNGVILFQNHGRKALGYRTPATVDQPVLCSVQYPLVFGGHRQRLADLFQGRSQFGHLVDEIEQSATVVSVEVPSGKRTSAARFLVQELQLVVEPLMDRCERPLHGSIEAPRRRGQVHVEVVLIDGFVAVVLPQDPFQASLRW